MLRIFKYKQVIVVRTDLKMSKGKLAAQVAHAAVEAAELARRELRRAWHAWRKEGQCKIVVKAKSEGELVSLYDRARRLGLPATLIRDRGLTELPSGTTTCLGIGPGPADLVDRVTGDLPLL